MTLTVAALFISLLADAGIAYAIYASGANPWYCMFAIIIWIPIFILLFGLYIVVLLIWGFFLDTKKTITRPSKFYYQVIKQTLTWFFTLIRVKVHVRGEPLPDEPFLLIMNHRSNFDPMAIIAGVKPLICFVTKEDNLKFPIAGPFIHHSGFLPLKRTNMKDDVEVAHRATGYLKDGVCSVGIAPEGLRNKTEEILLPFKPGSFRIGTEIGAPIVVCVVKNADKVSKNAPFKTTHIFLDFLRVIPAEEYREMDHGRLVSYCESIVRRDLEEGDMLLDLSFD